MRAEGVPEARAAYPRVEDGEVRRMEHAVADAAKRGAEREHRIVRGKPLDEHAGDDERHAEEHAARAVAVHDEAGERLQKAREA